MLCCKNSRIRLMSYGRGSSGGCRLALLLAESGPRTNAGTRSGGGPQTSYKYWEDSVALLFTCCLLLRCRSRGERAVRPRADSKQTSAYQKDAGGRGPTRRFDEDENHSPCASGQTALLRRAFFDRLMNERGRSRAADDQEAQSCAVVVVRHDEESQQRGPRRRAAADEKLSSSSLPQQRREEPAAASFSKTLTSRSSFGQGRNAASCRHEHEANRKRNVRGGRGGDDGAVRSPPLRIRTPAPSTNDRGHDDLIVVPPPCMHRSIFAHRQQDDIGAASSFTATEDDVAEFAIGLKKGGMQTWLRVLQSFARGLQGSSDTRWTNDNAIVVEARVPPLPFLWHSEAEQSKALTLLLVLLNLCGADAYEKRDASFLVCLVRIDVSAHRPQRLYCELTQMIDRPRDCRCMDASDPPTARACGDPAEYS